MTDFTQATEKQLVDTFKTTKPEQWDSTINRALGPNEFNWHNPELFKQLNQDVDFTKLGFTQDFQIVGMEKGLMLTDQAPVMTDGRPMSNSTLAAGTKDGSYGVVAGPPDTTDTHNTMAIQVWPTDKPFISPGVALDDAALAPTGTNKDVYSVLAPPGSPASLGSKGSDRDVADNTIEDTFPLFAEPKDRESVTFTGHLNDGFLGFGDTRIDGQDQVNPLNKLESRFLFYQPGWSGKSIKFQGPNGVQEIDNVTGVETERNPAGLYDTKISIGTDGDKHWRAISDPQGKILTLNEEQSQMFWMKPIPSPY